MAKKVKYRKRPSIGPEAIPMRRHPEKVKYRKRPSIGRLKYSKRSYERKVKCRECGWKGHRMLHMRASGLNRPSRTPCPKCGQYSVFFQPPGRLTINPFVESLTEGE